MLADQVLAGDQRAIARAISLLEEETSAADALVRAVYPRTGRAWRVGVTGPPGAGKSTLVDRLTTELRGRAQTVGVLAVDPTSPFSGGAILGDRVRMQAHAGDAGVFIRSMATRGHLGGLARATDAAALVLDAAGFDVILIETVGVGQDEVEIVRTADICLVTVEPGGGDDIQALKAGLMEIADIFVVNKADREGAARAVAALEAMLSLQPGAAGTWRPPVLQTVATTGAGVSDLLAAMDRYRAHAHAAGSVRRQQRAATRLHDRVRWRFSRYVASEVLTAGELDRVVAEIAARRLDPDTAAAAIVARALAPSLGPSPTPPPAEAGRAQPRAFRPPGDGATGAARLDHVGIAVVELEHALAFYRDGLGLEVDRSEDVPSQGVRVQFIATRGAALELLEATAPDTPVGRYLARRGPGLHHITLRVADLRATLARLKTRGVRLIDEVPRRGAHDALVAFVHPASTHGVLVELTQYGDRPEPGDREDRSP